MKKNERTLLKSAKLLMSSGIVTVAVSALLGGCASKKTVEEVKHEDLKRDYVVRDSNLNIRPTWVGDAVEWAKDHGELDKFRYFSFATDAKVDREMACEFAKTNARADIASEIATFIEKELGASKEGAPSIDANNPKTSELREFLSVTLAEKTKALINGAEVDKVYWEKRQYLESLGAKKDYTGYSCSALIRIDRKRLSEAVQKATDFVVNKADDPQTKENVKNALKNVSENFDKAKQGMI
jgi:hypothetical protein